MGYTIRAAESGASGWLKGGLGGGQKNQVSEAAAIQPIAKMTRRLTIRLPIFTPPLQVRVADDARKTLAPPSSRFARAPWRIRSPKKGRLPKNADQLGMSKLAVGLPIGSAWEIIV